MTYLTWLNNIRFDTKTDDDSFSLADIVAIANRKLDQLSLKINATPSTKDILGVPAFADLVDDQREYPFPGDILNSLLGAEIKLGNENTEWIRSEWLDLGFYDRTTDETTIRSQFANSPKRVFHDRFRGSLFIYSGAIEGFEAGNKALKVWYQGRIEPLTTTLFTDVSLNTRDMSETPTLTEADTWKHGIPLPLQEIVARYVVRKYKLSVDRNASLEESEQKLELDEDVIIKGLVHGDTGQSIDMSAPDMSEDENYGFDL